MNIGIYSYNLSACSSHCRHFRAFSLPFSNPAGMEANQKVTSASW